MRAYYLCGALILFNLALPVVTSLGFAAPPGVDPGEVYKIGEKWDWASFATKGVATFMVGAAAAWFGLRVNMGALVFAIVFIASEHLFSGTLAFLQEAHGIASSVVNLILISVWVVFLFAFIQLSSAPVERD